MSIGSVEGGAVGSGIGGMGAACGIAASPVPACGSTGEVLRGASPERWPGTSGDEAACPGRGSPGWSRSGESGVKSSGA